MSKSKEARNYLRSKNIPNSVLNANKFADISAKMQTDFNKTLNLIAFLRMSGSGYGPFPYTTKALRDKYN